MTRREWLEKFIELADSGAPTVEYRRHCRVKAQHLPRHVRKLDQYRAELAKLVAQDEPEEVHYAIHSVAFKNKDTDEEPPVNSIDFIPYVEVEDDLVMLDSFNGLTKTDLGDSHVEDIEGAGEGIEGHSELLDRDDIGESGTD